MNSLLTRFLLSVISAFFRFVLFLRYRIEFKGLEHLASADQKRGILFLPNHVSEIDPVFLLTVLWNRYQLKPIVLDKFYDLPLLRTLMRKIGCIPIPDLECNINGWKRKRVEAAQAEVARRLQQGDNFLIFPSGRLRNGDLEKIGGASFVANLLAAAPDTPFFLIRMTGLWGSRFSKGVTGKTTHVMNSLWDVCLSICSNGIFFMPRRKILIEIEPAPSSFPVRGTRLQINQALEAWYNKRGPEPLQLVPEHFWSSLLPQVESSSSRLSDLGAKNLSDGERTQIINYISELCARPSDKTAQEITASMNLSYDLGLDSIDMAQLHAFLDRRYGVGELSLTDLQTVEDALKIAAAGNQKLSRSSFEAKDTRRWPKEHLRPSFQAPDGRTIQEAFLRVSDRMKDHVCCRDAVSGMLSYRKLKRTALILADAFGEMEGDRIGVALPASIGVNLTVLALLLAKKVPVMLNWSQGVKNIESCAKLAGIKQVISSRAFLSHLPEIDFGSLQDSLIYLEEFKVQISARDALRGLWLSFQSADRLLKKLHLQEVKESDPCVILFTSGTESLPKGVPLSHSNILKNLEGTQPCIDYGDDDILYAVLPPFHSLGFSMTGLFPILWGSRVYFGPNLRDSARMAKEIESSQASWLLCVPTFIRTLFEVTAPEQLKTLRYIMSGGERTPPDLFEAFNAFGSNKQILVGYGVTECSPGVSIYRSGPGNRGVGLPLKNVEVKAAHPETGGMGPFGNLGRVLRQRFECIRRLYGFFFIAFCLEGWKAVVSHGGFGNNRCRGLSDFARSDEEIRQARRGNDQFRSFGGRGHDSCKNAPLARRFFQGRPFP